MMRLAVLASHEGSTLQALIDACANRELDAQVVLVISNNSQAGALRRADVAGIERHHISGKTHVSQEGADHAMAAALNDAQVDWVLLLGYMKKMGDNVLSQYSGRIINTHPALLPASKQGRFRQLSQATKLTKMGGDCYLFGMLAMGALDLGVEAGLNAYDIQALMPIVRGAGGVVTGLEGGNPSLGGTVLASATQALHSEAMTLLGSA